MWATDNVVQDGGPVPYSKRVLATLLNADFNAALVDQPILLPSTLNYFQLTDIIVAAPSTSLTLAAGGFYPQINQGGSPIVATAQTYSALTTSLLLMKPTITAYGQAQYFSRVQLANWALYFNLTTAQGTAANANIYVVGVELG